MLDFVQQVLVVVVVVPNPIAQIPNSWEVNVPYLPAAIDVWDPAKKPSQSELFHSILQTVL